ncbi:NAD(P)H-hydrate dehydratase [Sphingomonas daechungensis]|uniref:ADP-dependent (S)-NAD(P)H-hydrate dehydratase n=1 Tax=Sphingomonas daechungensis TaxID=1176646 RepID=A0ABX6SY08_9SPHN|nr:NAD(P)H-hydrate dehydratase [Sphingomonas daechungensis]QNP42355.1 NAD(P)H-hydrate dehydratase [Sphingomonas daechungensis]
MRQARGKPLNRSTLKGFALPPVVDGDKETKGRILVVAGSREVAGAALLTATAAMRAGAGKLRMATVDSVAVPTSLAMPEAMVVGLAEARDGGFTRRAVRQLREQADSVDVVVAGPGMAVAQTCAALAEALIESSAAVVLDAALLHSLKAVESDRRRLPPILLPHSGELASLLECEEEEIEADPIGCGVRAAQRHAAIVLVKGVTSHVVTPDGKAWTYEGGAPGLGVSGSGDTLAGIVGGLLARGADPLTALLWSVLLHGEAGEVLSRKVGPIGFLAREIPDEIPELLAR